MAAVDDLDQVIEQFQLALGEFVKGNPGPCKKVFSHRDDVSLANRFGPPRVDGSRLVRLWSMPHRRPEMARSLRPRS